MIEKYLLSNGIPVYHVATNASPVVSIQAWVRRGSAYETEDVAGISHFLEHALFKGTKRRGVGEIALEIESRGGEINAFTSFEETAYYTTMASRYFEDGLDVIADALQSPALDAEEMAREREVILEEIRRAQDSPFKMVSTNLWGTAFAGTPFGRPVLGFEETVRKIDHRSLRRYLERHYHAGTTALFIVGDVDPARVREQTRKKFSKMRKGKSGSIAPFTVKPPTRPKITMISRSLSECQFQLAALAPAISHESIPALDLACTALGQGESARLHQRLVKEKKFALEAYLGLTATSRCGMATGTFVATPDHVEDTLREYLSVVHETIEQGLSEREIERVKMSLEAEVVGGKETVEGYARRLGYYYCQFGDPDYERRYLERILAVTREEATAALAHTFRSGLVLSLAHPNEAKLEKASLARALERPKRKAAAKPAKASAATAELVRKDTVRYVTKTVESLPMVSVRLLFPGGSREETPGQYGIASLFPRVWASGTRSYSALQIAETLESLGASIHAFSGRNTVGLAVEFLSKHWPIVKPILSEILTAPTFPEEEFDNEKRLMLQEIASERDTPGQLCHLNFSRALYGDHPYGRSPLGDASSVGALTPDHLRAYYRDFVHRGSLVVSAVGYLERERWVGEIQSLVDNLPGAGRAPSPPVPIVVPDDLRIVTEKKTPLQQSNLLVGFLGASIRSPERYALKLLSSCLAGQGGRLFLELRDRQSLAYSVSPMTSDSPEPGIFAFYIGCAPGKLAKSLSGIRGEIEKILQAPMPAKELDRAKKYWLGRFELDMQRFASQAMIQALDEVYGIGHDHARRVPEIIKSISARDIQSAAQKYLRCEAATISVVHDEALDEAFVRDAWRLADSPAKRHGSQRREEPTVEAAE